MNGHWKAYNIMRIGKPDIDKSTAVDLMQWNKIWEEVSVSETEVVEIFKAAVVGSEVMHTYRLYNKL